LTAPADRATAEAIAPAVAAERTRMVASLIRLTGDDLQAAEARVLAAGATKYGFEPNAGHCNVFADPAGHPFCLSTWDEVPS
jgi:Glyoxalase-like domain